MTTAVSPQTVGARKARLPPVLHSAVSLALLVAAAILDITKPFDKSWSIFCLVCGSDGTTSMPSNARTTAWNNACQ